MANVKDFLRDYAQKESLFNDKRVLQSNYTPSNVPYREDQINQIAAILAPSLRMERPSNIFLYGKTGTGKTLVVNHVTNQILEVANENKLNLNLVKLYKILSPVFFTISSISSKISKSNIFSFSIIFTNIL